MGKFKIALDDLLKHCHEGLELYANGEIKLFFDAPEYMEVHGVPRLLILLDGRANFSFYDQEKIVNMDIDAPAVFYCAREAWLIHNNKYRNRALSFSFLPNYIRAMHIDYDGVNPPPTERDVYFHTSTPLPDAGMSILSTLRELHESGYDNVAASMLKPLFELTVEHLSHSSQGPVMAVRPLFQQINTFLREHRNEPLTREMIADIFVISPGYVTRLCKEYVGKNFSELKLDYQFEHAVHLLMHSRLTVDEIAQQSGFAGANYFIRRFKKKFGVTPHVYRNSIRKKLN